MVFDLLSSICHFTFFTGWISVLFFPPLSSSLPLSLFLSIVSQVEAWRTSSLVLLQIFPPKLFPLLFSSLLFSSLFFSSPHLSFPLFSFWGHLTCFRSQELSYQGNPFIKNFNKRQIQVLNASPELLCECWLCCVLLCPSPAQRKTNIHLDAVLWLYPIFIVMYVYRWCMDLCAYCNLSSQTHIYGS